MSVPGVITHEVLLTFSPTTLNATVPHAFLTPTVSAFRTPPLPDTLHHAAALRLSLPQLTYRLQDAPDRTFTVTRADHPVPEDWTWPTWLGELSSHRALTLPSPLRSLLRHLCRSSDVSQQLAELHVEPL